MSRITLTFIIGIFLLITCISTGWTLPEYARSSNQSCAACHKRPGGGDLTDTGLEFAASGYVWPPTGGFRVLGPIKKPVRFVIGYLHILAAFIWFGTILYVHILLRPGYAAKGLPKGEVWFGIISMTTVGISGTLLTISKIKSINVLYNTPWGRVLALKIFIYLIMISSAAFVVTFVGPRLKNRKKGATIPPRGVFDPVALSMFDGQEGRPAYIAYKGRVYDLGSLKLWKDGRHMMLHSSGEDLSDAITRAPHGEEKLDGLKVAGTFDASLTPQKTPVQKTFYFIAYMNLTLVFAVLLIIAFWRWGM